MVNTVDPKLIVNIEGEGTVTKWTKNLSWTAKSQKELVYCISSTEGLITIPLDDIENLKVFTISAPESITIKFTMVSTDVIEFNTDTFILTPDSSWLSTVSKIEISTSSTEDIKIAVNLYGQKV